MIRARVRHAWPTRPRTGLGLVLVCLHAGVVARVTAQSAAPATIPATAPIAAPALTVTPYRTSGTYDINQTVGWTLRAATPAVAGAGRFRYRVRVNNLAVIDSGILDLSRGTATIETRLAHAGMIVVEITPPPGLDNFGDPSTGGKGRWLLGAAVAPTSIQPSAPRPTDFDAFWKAHIDSLERIPVQATLTPGASDVAGVEYFTLRMNNLKGAHIYGQLAKPVGAGPFPALLILQWASAPYPLLKSWVTSRAAEGWLVLNVEPHDVPSDMPPAFYAALPQLIKSYHTIGNTDRDASYFLSMYLGDVRAANYLSARSDWNGKTLVVMGTSMGGQQSFAVAALQPRVTHMIVHVPSGTDALGLLHGRATGYPNWDVRDARVAATAPYFDAVNFASRVTATSLVSMGFIDNISPPVGIWTAFNQIRGPKRAVPLIDAHHNHLATVAQQLPYTSAADAWLRTLVRGGIVVP